MVCVTLCIPCQYGHHENHIPESGKLPGRMGGFECPCDGDCAGNLPRHAQEIIDAAPLSLPEGWPCSAMTEPSGSSTQHEPCSCGSSDHADVGCPDAALPPSSTQHDQGGDDA